MVAGKLLISAARGNGPRDKVAARKSYQDFLTLWKDADPDIPIYKEIMFEVLS
jgi:hypothetical protein